MDHLPSQHESLKAWTSVECPSLGFPALIQTVLPPVSSVRARTQQPHVQTLKRRDPSLKERPIEPD